MTHVAQAQVWRAQRTFHVISCIIFMRSCCVLDSPRLFLRLLADYLLSYRPVHLPCSQLLLLPRCGGQIPCALSLMTTLQPCRVRPSHILCQDCYEKDNSKKLYDTLDGQKFQIGNAFSLTERNEYACLCMWTMSNGRKETKSGPNVEDTYERR